MSKLTNLRLGKISRALCATKDKKKNKQTKNSTSRIALSQPYAIYRVKREGKKRGSEAVYKCSL